MLVDIDETMARHHEKFKPDNLYSFVIFGMLVTFAYLQPFGYLVGLYSLLAAITWFRKELSSNSSYRGKTESATRTQLQVQHEVITKRKISLQRTSSGQDVELSYLSVLEADDLFLHIFTYLDDASISRFAACSKRTSILVHSSDLLWEQLWKIRYGETWKKLEPIRNYRNISWNPYEAHRRPPQGWRLFVEEFEFCWIDWLLAGCNTSECCMIGLEGRILDITSFLPFHPGSPETILCNAGGDVTRFFNDVGHSITARDISEAYIVSVGETYTKGQRYTQRQRLLLQQGKEALLLFVTASSGPSLRERRQQKASTLTPVSSAAAGHSHTCLIGQCHSGTPRAVFDPLARRWYGWWSCCGLGCPIETLVAPQDEDSAECGSARSNSSLHMYQAAFLHWMKGH